VYICFFIKRQLKKRKDKNRISFDEFDDIEKIKEREAIEKASIEFESKVLDKVYKDTYNEVLNNSTSLYKHTQALLEANNAREKAAKDLHDFRIIDSVEVDKESIKEGSSIDSLRENGNDIDIELFKKWCRQIFGCIKIGTDEQLEIVKKFISEELYNKFTFQIKQFEKDGLQFITEDLMINECKIYDYSKSLNKEEIIVYIDSMMKEYIISKNDNKIIRGNKEKFKNKRVLMTFSKKENLSKEGIIYNCPNCGGKLDNPEFGKCKYCNTLIFPIRYNWTLTKFETI